MLVASVRVSICPGCVPPVKAAVQEALGAPGVPAGFLGSFLAEVGEVNTLCCFFACENAHASLEALDGWLDSVKASVAGAKLRHVERVLHRSSGGMPQWKALVAASGVALVQRVFDRVASPARPADGVQLDPLTGRHGQTWLLTAAASHDAALALCLAGSLDPQQPLRDSLMWIPAHHSPA